MGGLLGVCVGAWGRLRWRAHHGNTIGHPSSTEIYTMTLIDLVTTAGSNEYEVLQAYRLLPSIGDTQGIILDPSHLALQSQCR